MTHKFQMHRKSELKLLALCILLPLSGLAEESFDQRLNQDFRNAQELADSSSWTNFIGKYSIIQPQTKQQKLLLERAQDLFSSALSKEVQLETRFKLQWENQDWRMQTAIPQLRSAGPKNRSILPNINSAFTKAVLKMNQLDYEGAYRYFTTAIEDLDKTSTRSQRNYSIVLGLRGAVSHFQRDPAAAIDDYSASLKARKNWRLYYNRGVAYLELGKYQHALIDFNESLDLSHTADGFRNRAITHFAMSNLEQAQSDLNKALVLNEKDEQLWFHLGLVHQVNGEFRGALAAYERAVTLHPNKDGYAQRNLDLLQTVVELYAKR